MADTSIVMVKACRVCKRRRDEVFSVAAFALAFGLLSRDAGQYLSCLHRHRPCDALPRVAAHNKHLGRGLPFVGALKRRIPVQLRDDRGAYRIGGFELAVLKP